MPSFDIVSKVDAQALDNAVNVTTKEITNRFDFKGSHVVIDLNKKDFKINIETDDDMKMRQLIDAAQGTYSYWDTGRQAVLRELLVNEGLAVHGCLVQACPYVVRPEGSEQ